MNAVCFLAQQGYEIIGGCLEMYLPYATIRGARTSFHQTQVFQPIDRLADRCPFKIKHSRQVGLCLSLFAQEIGEDPPLGARQSRLRDATFECLPQCARDLLHPEHDLVPLGYQGLGCGQGTGC
jgi:hypothetical protein